MLFFTYVQYKRHVMQMIQNHCYKFCSAIGLSMGNLFLNPTCAFTTVIDGVLGVVCVGHHQAAMIVRTLQFMDNACIDVWPMSSALALPFGQTSSLPAPKRIRSLTLKSPSQALAKPSSWAWVLESLGGGDDIAAATRFNSARTCCMYLHALIY